MIGQDILPPFIEISGSWEEMGAAHGEQCGDMIRELAEVRIAYLARRYGRVEIIKAAAENLAMQIKIHSPIVHAETLATSRAASIAYWKLVVAGALSDIDDLVSRVMGHGDSACQECTVIPMRMGNGEIVIAGTWDTHANAAKFYCVLCRRPSNGPATLALTTFGWPMQQGLNDQGLAFVIANLVASSAGNGVPYIAALPLVASCYDIPSALALLGRTPHCSGRFYGLATSSEYCGVEVVPGCAEVFGSSLIAPHTNHYIFEGSRRWEGRPEALENSVRRIAVALAKSRQCGQMESWIDIFRIFVDGSLTQSGEGDDDLTGAVFVLSPRGRALHFINGPPSAEDIPERVRRYTL